MEDINCPFCNQGGFDLIGLKHHFIMGYCDVYNSTISVEEERKQRHQKDSIDKVKLYVHPEKDCIA